MEKKIYFDRYSVTACGKVWSFKSGRYLKAGQSTNGYLSVSLYDGSIPKDPKSFSVHKLVAEAFLGESNLHVNHKNGNKHDNRLENLEYVTLQENIRHSINVLGNTQSGEKNARCKIPLSVIEEIKKSDRSNRSWAEELGCTHHYIYQVRKGLYRKNG